jgi:RNA polymerase sigma-70 factor, ECF subfamily
MSTEHTHAAVEAVWRIEASRLIAGLARITRDVSLAEDLAQEALLAAFRQWPEDGVPRNPGAWLMAAAKRRALDGFRRTSMLDRNHAELGRTFEAEQDEAVGQLEDRLDDDVGDDLLRLIFTACHPVLPPESQVALTLRMIGGLSTGEIARAFLTPEPTIAQRIVRAKRSLSEAKVPFELPRGADRAARLGAVLGVIYLIFNEGYSATSGTDWMRPQLCEEAMRVGRILAALVPGEPEVHGLVALMELQASRLKARTAPDGSPILLTDQNRALWDQLLIRRGFDGLVRAGQTGQPGGPYVLQAAIAACHARARTPEATEWGQIASLYLLLENLSPSPVITLNRAVALGMAEGPEAGLALVDTLLEEPALKAYHLLPSVRGDLLYRLGRFGEARSEFERAAALTQNDREQALLRQRAAACGN